MVNTVSQMTPAELTRIGQRLYGPLWKAKLARELGRSRFTLYRWAAGTTPISGPAAKRIRHLASQAEARISALSRSGPLDGGG